MHPRCASSTSRRRWRLCFVLCCSLVVPTRLKQILRSPVRARRPWPRVEGGAATKQRPQFPPSWCRALLPGFFQSTATVLQKTCGRHMWGLRRKAKVCFRCVPKELQPSVAHMLQKRCVPRANTLNNSCLHVLQKCCSPCCKIVACQNS